MIIDLRTIKEGTRRFRYTLEPDWWGEHQEGDRILGLDGPVEVQVNVYRAGSKFVLEGRLTGGLLLQCDRCLEPLHRDLKSEFRVFLTLPPPAQDPGEVELAEEDLMVDFITGEEIDVDDIVREEIYLSLPLKSVCDEACRGLCPECGTNLNVETCRCRRDRGNPAFTVLKNLKLHS
jgi:uncharacterized protein